MTLAHDLTGIRASSARSPDIMQDNVSKLIDTDHLQGSPGAPSLVGQGRPRTTPLSLLHLFRAVFLGKKKKKKKNSCSLVALPPVSEKRCLLVIGSSRTPANICFKTSKLKRETEQNTPAHLGCWLYLFTRLIPELLTKTPRSNHRKSKPETEQRHCLLMFRLRSSHKTLVGTLQKSRHIIRSMIGS